MTTHHLTRNKSWNNDPSALNSVGKALWPTTSEESGKYSMPYKESIYVMSMKNVNVIHILGGTTGNPTTKVGRNVEFGTRHHVT